MYEVLIPKFEQDVPKIGLLIVSKERSNSFNRRIKTIVFKLKMKTKNMSLINLSLMTINFNFFSKIILINVLLNGFSFIERNDLNVF